MKHVPNNDKILFKDMTSDERSAIVESWLKGEVEYAEDWEVGSGEWKTKTSTSKLSPSSIYRTKPKQLVIPWGHIKPEYKWACMDEDGSLFVSMHCPSVVDQYNCWGNRGLWGSIAVLDIDTAGIDWKDSLVQRPEGV